MCRPDALTTCTNHRPVPCRQLHVAMHEDPHPAAPRNHMVSLHHTTSAPVVTTRIDGLGCPACGSFEPNEKPSGHAR